MSSISLAWVEKCFCFNTSFSAWGSHYTKYRIDQCTAWLKEISEGETTDIIENYKKQWRMPACLQWWWNECHIRKKFCPAVTYYNIFLNYLTDNF